MGVDLLRLVLVEADKSVQNVVTSQTIIVTSLIIREVVLHWADWQLLLESIDLVQKQNYRGLDEPSRVADRVEESEGLLHTVDGLVFEKKLIVLRDGDKEENSCDILEAVNPLLSFRSLSSDIKHAVCKITDDESRLSNTGRLYPRSQDILVVRHIVGLSDTLNIVEVARNSALVKWDSGSQHYNILSSRIVQLIFS